MTGACGGRYPAVMQRWLAGALAALAIGCGGGDEEACEEADKVANEIREQAMQDGLDGPPCVVGPEHPNPVRAAEYKNACARYLELHDKCEG